MQEMLYKMKKKIVGELVCFCQEMQFNKALRMVVIEHILVKPCIWWGWVNNAVGKFAQNK